MVQQIEITLKPKRRGFHLVTSEILSQMPKLPKTGIVNIFTKHTSCGLSINENCDPDFDSIWRTQDEIRTVVNAVLGECIWNLSYNERRMAIELELTVTLDDDAIGNLCCQFPITADYDGIGAKGSKFAFYL